MERCWSARSAAAVTALLLLTPMAAATVASAGPSPLSTDFSGDGRVADLAAFGVYGAIVEVTIRASTGIAAGPLQVSAGAQGNYNWSLAQVTNTSLTNLTLRAWLPWDPNVTTSLVFDISNGTPTSAYPGQLLTLPFNASETVALDQALANVTLPRGRSTNVTIALRNTGNVSLAHDRLVAAPASPNLTASLVGAAPGLTERQPGAVFSYNVSLSAPASAGPENTSVILTLASLSGANFTFVVVVRIVFNRDAAVTAITSAPSPPDEGRPAILTVAVENRGLDFAPSVDVQIHLFNATEPTLYANSTRLDLAAGAFANASFAWTPTWSPDPLTAFAATSAAIDFDPSNDALIVAMSIHSTNEPPAVSFSTPQDGARVSSTVPVAGTVVDPEGRNFSVDFSVDGAAPFLALTTASFGFVWDVGTLSDGPHRLSARAVDERGNFSTAAVDVTVLNRGPNAAPLVTVDNPFEGDVVGATTVLAGHATDERGELSAVFISVDGGPELTANGTTNWSLLWNASALATGAHQLSFRAWDGIDSSALSVVNVTVNPAAPASIRIDNLTLNPSLALPGQRIAVTGRALYNTGAGVPLGSISATVRGYPTLFETTADSRGAFTLNVTAPAADGNFTVDAQVRDGNFSGGASAPLRVSVATLPDIELLPSDFSISPDPPVPNEAAHHTINIRNIGASAANVTLRVFENGTLLFEWTGFVQSSRQAVFDRAYPTGVHNLTIRVVDVSPQDGNASNNALDVSLDVPGLPDFAIESITPSLTDPRPGQNITFLIVVRNVGVSLGTAAVEIWDGIPLGANSTLVKQQFIGLNPGDRDRVLAVWTPTAGNHEIYAKVILSQPAEINLLNNQLNLTMNVKGNEPPAPPVFLPGFGGALAAAALVGAVWKKRGTQDPPRRRNGARSRAAAGAMLAVAACIAALAPSPTGGSLDDAGAVPGPLEGVCQTCHMNPNGGGPLNDFGADYWDERNATNRSVNWTRLGALDSDGDGFSNSDEWNASYLPGDAASNPRTGVKYGGFSPSGITGFVTALLALLFVTIIGVWLGASMVRRRTARLAKKEAGAKEAAPTREPPAPKP